MGTKRGAGSKVGGSGRASAAGAAIVLALLGVGCAEGLTGGGVFDESGAGGRGDGGASGDGGGGGARDDGPSSSVTSTSVVSSSAATTGATTAASTTTSTGGGCTAANFACGDGSCIALAAACNGIADCWGATDEAPQNPQCGGAATTTSAGGGSCAGQFMCGDGSCIDPFWECDGWPDCADLSDEASCPCDGFTCGDGSCISASWECDGIVDCGDGSDESSCGGGGGGSWTCDPSYYGDGDCDCGCGELDLDCPTGASVAECEYCALGGGCASSCADIDPSQNWLCL